MKSFNRNNFTLVVERNQKGLSSGTTFGATRLTKADFGLVTIPFCLLLFGLTVACSSENSGSDVDVRNDPYTKWDANTAVVFEGATANNPSATVKFEKIPGTETVVEGRTYNDYNAGLVASKSDPLLPAAENTGSATAAVDEDGTIYITTVQSNGLLGELTGLPGLDIWLGEEVVLKEPVSINMEEMATDETRDAVIEFEALGQTIPVSVSYGPVEDDVTLMSAMGPIVGCRKFDVEGSFEMAGLPLTGTLIKGSGYYHPTLGLVGWEAPDLGIGLSMSGTSNYGDATEGHNVIEKSDILTSTNSSFRLDTYDRIDQFDADKDTHAKMLLELRWADPTVATTHDEPDGLMAPITFGTLGGIYYFPHQLIESPVSIFFPEENGNDFRYWYAFVDQAAKNQDENGISYSITVDKDSTLPDLRVTARIGYTILPVGTY